MGIVPPPGESLPHKVSISFLPDNDQHQLPIDQACFGYFKLQERRHSASDRNITIPTK